MGNNGPLLRRLFVPVLLAIPLWACDKSSPTEPDPAPCTFSLSKTSLSFGAAGGADSLNVTTASNCAWSATSDGGWMSITSGASGTGSGLVQVSVAANSTESARTGTLTIAGIAVAVVEEGLAPCSIGISPDRASFAKDSVHGSFNVSAAERCQWSAVSQAAWITVRSGNSGAGNGTVGFSIEENLDTTPRTGTIAVGQRTFTVTQAGGTLAICTYSLSATSLSFGAGGGSQSITVGAPGHCTWDVSSDSPWISIGSAASVMGNGAVTITATPNLSTAARTGTVTVAGQAVSVRQDGTGPPPPCTYTVSPVELVFGSGGGSDSATVTTATNCTWTASDDSDWITITSGASGAGNGTVRITVAANPTNAARTGTLTVAAQSISVRQGALAPCSVDITPASASYSKDAATGSFAVTAPAQCAWTGTPSDAWVTITSGSSGTGSGTIAYSVAANSSVAARSATISVANRTFSISQLGDTGFCDYLVQPVDVSACMVAPSLSVSVTTQAGCTWTATPDAPWITVISGQSGVGSGVINFRLSDNYVDPRQGILMVRWPTATAGQNVRISQAGCRYAVSTSGINIPVAGGTGAFNVFQVSDPNTCGGPLQDRCVWTATSDVPWISITTPSTQMGDNPVSFTVAPNGTGATRTGQITVRDKVVVVTQAGS